MKTIHRSIHPMTAAFLLSLFVLLAPGLVRANCYGLTDLFVDISNTSGTEDGAAWSTAFTSLQDALACATSGDNIHVAEGTYLLSHQSGSCRPLALRVRDGIDLLGGYPSGGGTRDAVLNVTIISGDQNANDALDQGDASVLLQMMTTSATNETKVDGFHFALAYQAILASNATLRLVDCSFEGMGGSAGLIELFDADLRIEGSTFESNVFSGFGAVITASGSDLDVENCMFKENTGSAFKAFAGSVLSAEETSSLFTNCVFLSNQSSNELSAPASSSTSTLSLVNCSFDDNTILDPDNASVTFSAVTLRNTILPDASVYDHLEAISSSAPSLDYCFVPTGYTTGTNIWDDAPGYESGTDLELHYTSSAVDKGLNSYNTTVRDLKGNSRVLDGNGSSSSEIDLGAYEFCPSNCAVPKRADDQEESMSFALYPNPTNGALTIESEEAIERVVILDATGRNVLLLEPANEPHRIDADLRPGARGIYFVEVTSLSGSRMEKVVLQ